MNWRWVFHRALQALIIFGLAKFLFSLKWHLVFGIWPKLLHAIWLTIELTAISLALGFLLAWPLALIRAKRNPKWAAYLADGFVAIFRGTPLLVQIYIIYYGLGGEEWMRNSFLWSYFREAYFCVILGFSLNSAAYACEIFRGALISGAIGEREAAMSLGLKTWQVDWLIWVPAAWRRALPQYGNEMVFMMHGTAIAGLVTLNEVFGFAKEVNSKFYVTYEGFLTAALIYILLTLALGRLSNLMEAWFLRHQRQ